MAYNNYKKNRYFKKIHILLLFETRINIQSSDFFDNMK